MSVFGQQTAQQPQSTGLFGSTSQPQQAGNFFGAVQTSQQQQQPQQQTGNLFGTNTQQQQQQPPQQQTGGCLAAHSNKPNKNRAGCSPDLAPVLKRNRNKEEQTSGGIFGSSITQQQQPQQQQPQPGGGLFSGFGQSAQQQQQPQAQQGSGLFSGLGASSQQPQQPRTQLGQSLQTGPTLWTPGQGMTGVHRTAPMQMSIVTDKWQPTSRNSPFRAHLYNNVGEDNAPFFQPGPNDDETKWEDALRKRPGPGYVPVLVQGFWELGKRAQRQRDFLAMMQSRLHEINNALTELLSRHDLKISVRIAACRRKHVVLSQRCLALAAKTQVLRNRGYAMDETEEELQKKLHQLERSVFDPSLNGRTEEIWARMLTIRERSKRLQLEMERSGQDGAQEADSGLDETAIKTAKKILDNYASQIQHLNKELVAAQKDFEAIHGPST
ncbi:hypothetical protein ACJ72_06692 [Emergomyces africanus]|uniref:Nucleoporin Nup54 alpha-helical domain-containing protein n=1 Tax=Emergomyces africanus TaxID=1955775 RepID=A0A1B7NQ88_9EURO|nr:hypothetical protein ACJ72_06692 [Emergomyces africanus]